MKPTTVSCEIHHFRPILGRLWNEELGYILTQEMVDITLTCPGTGHSVSQNEEFFTKNEELCMNNEEFCIKNDEFCSPNAQSLRGARWPFASKSMNFVLKMMDFAFKMMV